MFPDLTNYLTEYDVMITDGAKITVINCIKVIFPFEYVSTSR